MDDPIVELEGGFARGLVVKHEDGFDYYAFKGIPYAEPPVGELRFKDPKPKESWAGVLDCKNYGPLCLQHDCFMVRESISEDCLHLNVFTRSINKRDRNTPVLFLIHGGGFIIVGGDDATYGPDYLIRKNIVLVLANYRVGVLGFLNLEDEIAPGNLGLRDLLLALEWVQKNIRQFGGDPNNVTLMGLSAGGMIANYLALSPLSKGLFHKVIFQCGILLNTWARIDNPKSIAIKLCSFLGKYLTDSTEILQFLKTVDNEALVEAQESLRLTLIYLHTFPFGPGRDDKSTNPVMPVDPETAANEGVHLPCIVGYNSTEFILLMKGMTRRQFFELCNIDYNSMFLYQTTDILYRYNLTKTQLKQSYYGDEDITDDNRQVFARLLTDLSYVESIHRFARIQSEQSSAATYLYVFSYDSPNSMGKILTGDKLKGACHLDDLPFFFKARAAEKFGLGYLQEGTKEYRLMEQVTEMWSNFATHGRPTVGMSELIPVYWTPLNDGTILRYLNIDKQLSMQSTISMERKLSEMANK